MRFNDLDLHDRLKIFADGFGIEPVDPQRVRDHFKEAADRIAELEAENAQLKQLVGNYPDDIQRLRAENEQLRVILDHFCRCPDHAKNQRCPLHGEFISDDFAKLVSALESGE